jgi:hypothetical protein
MGVLHGRVAQAATTVILAVAVTFFGGMSVSSLRQIPIHETLFRRVGCLMTGRHRLDETLGNVAANLRCADPGRLKKPSQQRS